MRLKSKFEGQKNSWNNSRLFEVDTTHNGIISTLLKKTIWILIGWLWRILPVHPDKFSTLVASFITVFPLLETSFFPMQFSTGHLQIARIGALIDGGLSKRTRYRIALQGSGLGLLTDATTDQILHPDLRRFSFNTRVLYFYSEAIRLNTW